MFIAIFFYLKKSIGGGNGLIRIGICDDDILMADCIKNIVTEYFNCKQIEAELILYHSGIEVIEKSHKLDLIFLDIEMPELDGMQVARYLYEKCKSSYDYNTRIVFLTSHNEVVRKAFQVEAFRFLIKDNFESELEECLDAFCRDVSLDVVFQLEKDNVMISVKQRDILYIKTTHNGSEIWGVKEVFNSSLSLNSWMAQLDSKIFIRTHKNTIVNLAHINYIDDYVYMYTGEKVEYSRRNHKELQRRFNQYIYENAK